MEELYKSFTITLDQDYDPESPRDWDNITTFALFHNHYDVPNESGLDHNDYNSWAELETAIHEHNNVIAIAPVYGYDHGIFRIKVGSFAGHLPQGHAEFDSGQLGFVYVTADQAKMAGWGGSDGEIRRQAEQAITGDVETYDQYTSGQVYGYTVTDAYGNEVDSLNGIYGYDEALDEAKSAADSYTYPNPATRAKRAQELHR